MLLFPALCQDYSLEGSKEKSETKLRVCHTVIWLETPLVDHDCHCSELFCFYLLFVPLWKTPGWDNKKCLGVFFLSVSMAKSNTSLKTNFLFIPKTPKWVTHIAVRRQLNPPRFSSCLNRAWQSDCNRGKPNLLILPLK